MASGAVPSSTRRIESCEYHPHFYGIDTEPPTNALNRDAIKSLRFGRQKNSERRPHCKACAGKLDRYKSRGGDMMTLHVAVDNALTRAAHVTAAGNSSEEQTTSFVSMPPQHLPQYLPSRSSHGATGVQFAAPGIQFAVPLPRPPQQEVPRAEAPVGNQSAEQTELALRWKLSEAQVARDEAETKAAEAEAARDVAEEGWGTMSAALEREIYTREAAHYVQKCAAGWHAQEPLTLCKPCVDHQIEA